MDRWHRFGRMSLTRLLLPQSDPQQGPVIPGPIPAVRDPMKAPIFGLSTTPITDTKSELLKEIERAQLAILYRPGVK